MTLTRFNPFTRWFLVATGILLLAVLLYVGEALAQHQESRPSAVLAAQIAPTSVTLLPDRVIMPPHALDANVSLIAYTVDTVIQDNLATTTITQTFKNASSRALEARYLFPLPKDANFSSLTLTVNGKALEGKMMEKNEAKATYEEIVRRLVDPALLEYIDDQTVQVSIAPFMAGETKQIRLSYSQLLRQDGGLYKYAYHLGSQKAGSLNRPVAVQPRPLHQTSASVKGPADMAAEGFTLNVALKTGQALKTIYSPTHDPQVERSGERQAKIKLGLTPGQLAREKQFVMYFSQANQAIALNTLNFQKAGEDGYYLMALKTPEVSEQAKALPKDVVLVVDTSGSMSGEKLQQAKEALKFVINRLHPQDRFGLLQFNTDVSAFNSEMQQASAPQKQKALDYVDALNADGSTNLEAALKQGFSLLKAHEAARAAYVIFLTDGEPTVGVTDTEGLVKVADQSNQGQVRLFNFGVGYNLNAVLLDKLAERHHGTSTFVEPNENLETALTGFYKKVESPVLTDAILKIDGVQVRQQYPDQLHDLFAGSEVILLGRYAGAGSGQVHLTGKMGDKAQSYSFPIQWKPDTTHSQLPRLWAGRRIAYLLDAIRQNGENKELKDEVIALSQQYGIITPYTSFLSTEPEEKRSTTRLNGASMFDASPAGSAPAPAAMQTTNGRGAVKLSKSLRAMKNQASVSALSDAQGADAEKVATEVTIQTVNGKTFVKSELGVWTDTAFDKAKDTQLTKVYFGSEAYFKLMQAVPELVPYFSVGEQVIVVLTQPDGSRKPYQVLPVM